MTRARTCAGLLIAVVCCVTIVGAQTGKASGSLTVNGKKVSIQNVSVVTYDTPSPGRLVSVLLSDKPADMKKFQEYSRIGPGERLVAGIITGAWASMHDDKAFSGFQFTFDANKRVILNDVLVGTRNDVFSIIDEYLVFEATSVSPRLVGRIRTKDAVVDLGSQKVGIDITFDAPVTQVGK